jgi:tetratricopeptide (TPR) repeat protein
MTHLELIQLLGRHSEQHPQNLQIRFLYADHLLANGQLRQAEAEFFLIIRERKDFLSRAGIARIHYEENHFEDCLNILQELDSEGFSDLNTKTLAARCFLRMAKMEQAYRLYKEMLQQEPHFFEPELDALRPVCF